MDHLEADWQAGQPRPLSCYAECATDAEMHAKLICCDLRWRWKTRDAETVDANSDQTGSLESYFGDLSGVAFSEVQMVKLIQAEFFARQAWGDRPRLQDYQRRFPQYFYASVDGLKNTLFTLAKLTMDISDRGARVFETTIDRPLVLGRQSGDEPAPYCRLVRREADRIIVATANERQVSRNAISIDLESVDRVSILNQSTYTPVSVGTATVLEPGSAATFPLPVTMTFADREISLH